MKIIIFDFDGVIVDTFKFSYDIWNTLSNFTLDEFRDRFNGNVNKSNEKQNLSEKEEDFFKSYTPNLMSATVYGGMADQIKILAEKYPLIIISSTNTNIITNYLESVGLLKYFKEILGNDVDRSKVNKINNTLQGYNSEPDEAIFITDTLGDILEAEKCGVKSIAVTWGYHPAGTLQKGNPYKIINKPEELAKL